MYYDMKQNTMPYFSGYNGQNNGLMQRQEIIRVSGENGAKALQMPPNSSVLLLDETNPIVWLKTTDGAGYPTLTPYTISPYKQEEPIDLKSLEQRIANIEIKIGEITNESNSSKPESVAGKHVSNVK